MSRTTAPLRPAAAAAAAGALLALWAAGPAQAHGAPTDPVSRTFACSPDGGAYTRTAACRAAVAANGAPFTFFDDVRVPDVGGRDRQVIPDGKLCSGGLSGYKGLDLTRPDWPATRLAPGARLTMTYAAPIPHAGTFRLYLTKPGYDPDRPLTWSDLPSRPFAEVKDPPLRDDAYRIGATLPRDRTGRQVLYTIWQTSSTPDTYYSCSDVVFPGGAAKSSASRPASAASASASGAVPASAATPSRRASATSPADSTGATAQPGGSAGKQAASSTPVADATGVGAGPSAPVVAGGAAAVLVLTGGAALLLRLRRR
ncbi:lytic polysaccharide monooxygenase [Streptomyces sp. NPDC047000]|uniref:lytic polysaccharide monooxygenase n=1 Tax=Streptomyces sp. NPDC047000 TaxID=3155474 RepID=UPI0033D2738D